MRPFKRGKGGREEGSVSCTHEFNPLIRLKLPGVSLSLPPKAVHRESATGGMEIEWTYRVLQRC